MLAIAGGKGWLYEETLELVKSLNLEAHVRFLSRVPDDDLHQLYVAARCHIHPAHYEGFGLPPLEAMACGTPTIVSNVSSLPEVVGDAALLVNPLDIEEIAVAMQRLLTDDDLHVELSEKGLQRARTFSWERAARRTLDVYRKVAEPQRTSSQRPAATTTPENGL
jgi:glycosyltransferase involved in cell wall biosynthesis